MIRFIGFCLIFASLCYSQSQKDLDCDCEVNSGLKDFINKGNIPESFFADNNSNEYQQWSSSILCPSSQLPEYPPEFEESSGSTELDHAEWFCMYSTFSLMDNDPRQKRISNYSSFNRQWTIRRNESKFFGSRNSFGLQW